MPKQIKRLTVEETREAAEAIGFAVRPNLTLQVDAKCGCPIGITSHHRHPKMISKDGILTFIDRADVLCLDRDYASFFAAAFDGSLVTGLASCNIAERLGYADGVAHRKAFVEEVAS